MAAVIASVIFIHSCTSDRELSAPEVLLESDILPHIQELSSDAYFGRMPFGPGDQKTVDYIVDQCKALGLKPGNNGSFTQSVPMIEITSSPAKTMAIETPTGTAEYKFGSDYVIHCQKPVDQVDVKDSELVFCGYGIVDEKLGWNDFEGVDMKDKIAVVLVNDPGYGGENSTFFKGDVMTYYGRWTYKYEDCLLYTSPSPRDKRQSRMPSSA